MTIFDFINSKEQTKSLGSGHRNTLQQHLGPQLHKRFQHKDQVFHQQLRSSQQAQLQSLQKNELHCGLDGTADDTESYHGFCPVSHARSLMWENGLISWRPVMKYFTDSSSKERKQIAASPGRGCACLLLFLFYSADFF